MRVSTFAAIKRVFQLSKQSLNKLPRLTTLPGIYTMDEIRRSKRYILVPTQSAVSAYRAEHAETGPTQYMIGLLDN